MAILSETLISVYEVGTHKPSLKSYVPRAIDPVRVLGFANDYLFGLDGVQPGLKSDLAVGLFHRQKSLVFWFRQTRPYNQNGQQEKSYRQHGSRHSEWSFILVVYHL